MSNVQVINEDKERERCAKGFAEILSSTLSAKEIAMILWEKECLFCVFNQDCWGDVSSETCATGVRIYANDRFHRMSGGDNNEVSD